jgi:hypothetical protein
MKIPTTLTSQTSWTLNQTTCSREPQMEAIMHRSISIPWWTDRDHTIPTFGSHRRNPRWRWFPWITEVIRAAAAWFWTTARESTVSTSQWHDPHPYDASQRSTERRRGQRRITNRFVTLPPCMNLNPRIPINFILSFVPSYSNVTTCDLFRID